MDAINLSTSPNFKTTYICSDHFDEKLFYYSDELRSRKRLRPEAVPANINVNQSYLSTENITKEPVTERNRSFTRSRVLVSSVNRLENNILQEKNLETNNKDCDKEIKICREKMPVNSLDEGSLNEQDCSYELNNSSVSNDTNSRKR
ncbi:hypothetical protein ALC57_15718 [Trachymyrmex cornetzi]|uniref:THAP-type domain-containing protein n=1 Tax=Trachymyrmex cornetzi TaxID=471704 RepID=A0A151IWC9_9HYME|nr:hypothetical protein ALC57_15718 [Trachymyrmex cornetzi]